MSEQPPKSPPRRAPRPPSPAGSTPRKTAAGKSATTSKATPTETTRPRATPAAARKPRSTVSKQPVAASPVPTQKATPPPAAKPVRSAAPVATDGAAVTRCACPTRAQAYAGATGRRLLPRHARDRMADLALAGSQARTRARIFRTDAHGSPGRRIAAAVADLVGPVVCRRRFSADWHSHHLHPGRGGDARRRLRDQRLCRSLLAGCPCRTHAWSTDGCRSRVQARSPAVVRGPAGVGFPAGVVHQHADHPVVLCRRGAGGRVSLLQALHPSCPGRAGRRPPPAGST